MPQTIFSRWSAFVPLLMSFAAFALTLAHVALFGAAREADEGSAAHVFQLLIACQAPIVAYFAVVWLPQALRSALVVLGAQFVAVGIALAPVWYFNL